MKTLSILVTLMACSVLTGTVYAQGKMGHMQKPMAAAQNPVMNCMMMGMSGNEKAAAAKLMGRMNATQKAVMMKRGALCMKDNHKALVGMKPSEDLMKRHLGSGLNASDQKTMMGIYQGLSKEEKPAFTKMITNCCMYGMKHAKSM